MKYIIAPTERAIDAGFSTLTHRIVNGNMILNEKELMDCPALRSKDTLRKKANAIGGTICTEAKILNIINNGDQNT